MFKRSVHPGTPFPPVRAPRRRTPSTLWRRTAMHFHTSGSREDAPAPRTNATRPVCHRRGAKPHVLPHSSHRDQHPDPPWLEQRTLIAFGHVFTSLLRFLADCASHRRSPTSIKYSRSLDERYNLVSVQNAMEEFKLRAGHCESRKSLDLVSLPVSLYSHTGMTGKIPTLEPSPNT